MHYDIRCLPIGVVLVLLGYSAPLITTYVFSNMEKFPWDIIHSITPQPLNLTMAEVVHYLTVVISFFNMWFDGMTARRFLHRAVHEYAPAMFIRAIILVCTVSSSAPPPPPQAALYVINFVSSAASPLALPFLFQSIGFFHVTTTADHVTPSHHCHCSVVHRSF